MTKRILFSFIVISFLIYSCSKKTDTYSSASLNDYFPMQVGKYITYRLDSLKFVSFGQKDTLVSYQVKDKVDAEVTDNMGRLGYRIIRYQRDVSSINENDWASVMTYLVVPTNQSVEVVENNLRFQKLRLPITEGYNWHGNAFLPNSPYETIYPFSNDEDMQFWDYTYKNVNQPLTVNDQTFDSTITIHQVEDSVNVPITQPDGLAYRNYWTESYAKHIGMIYKEVVMWEYQPPNGSNPGYKTGFGIRMTILDHN